MYYLTLLFVILFAAMAANAEDYTLTLKDHKFQPAELTIPSGQKVKITVKNLDVAPAEFESFDLNREKVVEGIQGGKPGSIDVYVGPLDPGKYDFFDDFHKATTTGKLIVK